MNCLELCNEQGRPLEIERPQNSQKSTSTFEKPFLKKQEESKTEKPSSTFSLNEVFLQKTEDLPGILASTVDSNRIVVILNLNLPSTLDALSKDLQSVAQTINSPLSFYYTLSSCNQKMALLCPSVVIMYQGEVISEVSLSIFRSLHISSYISFIVGERLYNESNRISTGVSPKFLTLVKEMAFKQLISGIPTFI